MEHTSRLASHPVVAVFVGLTVVAGGVAVSTSAEAQEEEESASSSESSSSDEEKARKVLKLVRQGKKASQAGNYEEALGHFQQAYELYPRPAILVRLGETAEQLERTEKAIEYYQTFLEEAPEDKKEIVSKIESRLERLKQSRRATLEVDTRPKNASVRFGSADGESASRAPLSRQFEPGETTIVASKEGYETRERTVSLEPGDEMSVTLELKETKPAASSSNSETKRKPSALHDVSENQWNGRRALWITGWTAGGVGVVGLGAGVLFTVLKSKATRSYNNYDPSQSDVSRLQLRIRAIANHRRELLAYGVGGFLTAVGTGLLTYHVLTGASGDGRSALRLQPLGGVSRDGAWGGLQLTF
jgi:hypothetical protein